MAKSRVPATRVGRKEAEPAVRIFTLDVFLSDGPITQTFAGENPVIARTIQMRGDQSLQDLHHAIFSAFDREEEHLYEFQLGEGPMDPEARRYVLPHAPRAGRGEARRAAGRVDQTRIDALDLKVGDRFGYWFD